jgi:hypothetical protein
MPWRELPQIVRAILAAALPPGPDQPEPERDDRSTPARSVARHHEISASVTTPPISAASPPSGYTWSTARPGGA